MTAVAIEQDIIHQLQSHGDRIAGLEAIIGPTAGSPPAPGTISGGGDGQPSHIIADSIISNMIYAGEVQAWLINSQHIATGSLTADVIDVNDLTADEAFITSLEAEMIAAGSLSAIWAQTGELVGGTITGGTIQTTSGRVVFDDAGIRGYKPGGNTPANKIFEINSGTGIAEFVGLAFLDPTSTVPVVSLQGMIAGGNILENSSAEATSPAGTIAPWARYGSAGSSGTLVQSSEQAFHGTYSLKLTGGAVASTHSEGIVLSGSGTGYPKVFADRPYVASCWVYPPVAMKFYIYRYIRYKAGSGAGGTTPSPTNATWLSPTCPANQWTRIVAPAYTVPANAETLTPYFTTENPLANGQSVYFDGMQLELGEKETAYSPKADEIVYGSIRSIQIGAGEVKANNIAAGAITAQMLSVSAPGSVVYMNNGAFTLDAATGGQASGWLYGAGNNLVVVTDDVFTRAGTINNPVATQSYSFQDITLPKGRHLVNAWMKTASVVGGGAGISFYIVSGSVTPTNSEMLTGTNDWKLVHGVLDVSSATAVVRVYTRMGFGANGSGQAWFANVNVQSSIGSTIITPGSISSGQINADSIRAAVLTTGSINVTAMLGDGVITAPKIMVNSITADRMDFHIPGRNMIPNSSAIEGFIAPWAKQPAPYHWNGNAGGNVQQAFPNGTGGSPPSISGSPAFLVLASGAAWAEGFGMSLSHLTDFVFKQGKKYTLSAYVSTLHASASPVQIVIGAASANHVWVQSNNLNNTAWQRLSVTWTPTADVAAAAVYVGVRTANASNQYYYATRFQLEEGDRVTDWKTYIQPTVMDGYSITSGVFRTALSGDRIEIRGDGTNNHIKAYKGTSEIIAIDQHGLRFKNPAVTLARGGTGGESGGVLSEIQWLDSTGYKMSSVMGGVADPGMTDANFARLEARGTSSSGRLKSTSALMALSNSDATQVYIVAESAPGTDYKAYAQVNHNNVARQRVLIDWQDRANYIQVGSTRRIIWRGPYIWQCGAGGIAAYGQIWKGISNPWGTDFHIVGGVHEWGGTQYASITWSFRRTNNGTGCEMIMRNLSGVTAYGDLFFWICEQDYSTII